MSYEFMFMENILFSLRIYLSKCHNTNYILSCSVLGPTLFLIYINELPANLSQPQRAVSYADNISSILNSFDIPALASKPESITHIYSENYTHI